MRHFLKLYDSVPVSQLLAEIGRNPDLWDEHSIRKTAPGTPHKEMSDIWVRYNDVRPFEASGDFRRFGDPHIPIWYRAWHTLPALHKIVFDLMSYVQGEMIGGVLITRIPPGGRIEKHIDESWHVSYFDKFYVSLESTYGADFCCEADGDEERINPVPGDVYRFDNRKLHWVENNSKSDRTTLIVCIRTEMFRGVL